MLSHFLLLIVLICLALLFKVTSSPMPGGDYGVGYAWAMILTGAGFILFSGFLFWNMYHIMPVPDFLQNIKPIAITIVWVSFVLAVCALSVFRTEWHEGEFPRFLKVLADVNGHIVLTGLVLGSLLLFMHHTMAQSQTAWFTKALFYPGILISFCISLVMIKGFISASHKQSQRHSQELSAREKSIKDEYWKTLNNFKPGDPLVYILSLTGRFHDDDVRLAAVAKVKSNPDWENELINLLETPDYIPYVYQFIDGNRVDHPDKFILPIQNSLNLLAQTIKDQIRNSNNLQDWHFESLSIERCIRAIDEQFSQNGGQEFVQPLQNVLRALQGPRPERFKDVSFTIEKTVKDWLKKHGR